MPFSATCYSPVGRMLGVPALAIALLSGSAVGQSPGGAPSKPEPAETIALRKMVAATPLLPLALSEFTVHPPAGAPTDWGIEMVSSAALDSQGLLYVLQRGDKADPILVVNRRGEVVRSFGRGLFTIPHSVRVDPAGNIWAVDAGSSTVHKFTPGGERLLTIEIGEMPRKDSGFRGAADIAFGPGGQLYVADGYGNARILVFSPEGRKLREWGRAGKGPGQFNLPHCIAIDRQGVVYVGDRENARIQRFDLAGNYLGEWTGHGKTFAIKVTEAGEIWIASQPRNVPNGAEGWLMRLDPATGKAVGHVVSFGHSLDVSPAGELYTGRRPGSVIVFRPARP